MQRTGRAAALAVIVVLLLGAGLNVKGEKSAARKGDGGNAKGGELKAKLADNEVSNTKTPLARMPVRV